MSEYQYYEFQAIDRPLSKSDQSALRAMSSRAQITSTSFTNEYSYGDFKGEPWKLMGQYFDLHLYTANWGTRRLMLRLPKRLIDKDQIDRFLQEADFASVKKAGDNWILDVGRDEVEHDGWLEGNGHLAPMTPLRADLLSGDHRMLYLIWLMAVEEDCYRDDEPEPLPGIGPLTGALEAFAAFFGIDPDLVAAAAERAGADAEGPAFEASAKRLIDAMPERDKCRLLLRLAQGDQHVGAELRALVRADGQAGRAGAPRTVGDLLARAEAMRTGRKKAAAAQAARAQRLAEQQAAAEHASRIKALAQRGDAAWRDVEAEIARSSASGYTAAAALLSDLREVAQARGTTQEFARRLAAIRDRHARKAKFVSRLSALEPVS